MKVHKYTEITNGIEIVATPYFVPEKSSQEMNYFFYAYQISITNHNDQSYQLLSRYWIIRDGEGKEEKIQGEGVVGQQPVLKKGVAFSYTSFCPLPTSTGNMRGHYQLKSSDGEILKVQIPLFFFSPKSTPHATLTNKRSGEPSYSQ